MTRRAWIAGIVGGVVGLLTAELLTVPPFSRWLDVLGENTWEGLPWVLLGVFWAVLGFALVSQWRKRKGAPSGSDSHDE